MGARGMIQAHCSATRAAPGEPRRTLTHVLLRLQPKLRCDCRLLDADDTYRENFGLPELDELGLFSDSPSEDGFRSNTLIIP